MYLFMYLFMYKNMLYSKALFQNIITLYDYRNPSIAAKSTQQNPILIFRRRNSYGKRHRKNATPTHLMYYL